MEPLASVFSVLELQICPAVSSFPSPHPTCPDAWRHLPSTCWEVLNVKALRRKMETYFSISEKKYRSLAAKLIVIILWPNIRRLTRTDSPFSSVLREPGDIGVWRADAVVGDVEKSSREKQGIRVWFDHVFSGPKPSPWVWPLRTPVL